MAFNARIPNNVATHVRKYSSTAQLVSKSKAGALGMVSGILYYKATTGVLIPVTSSNFADGTSLLPSIAYASEPTLGFFRSSATIITATGNFNVTGESGSTTNFRAGAAGAFYWSTKSLIKSPTNGIETHTLQDSSIGVEFKYDALPTVASGFGTSPSVTAGSTPMAGSINVGTGGVATTGVINFNGTAFPSAPFVVCMNTTTGAVVRATTSTTQLTITAPAAFTASDVVCWICVSSK